MGVTSMRSSNVFGMQLLLLLCLCLRSAIVSSHSSAATHSNSFKLLGRDLWPSKVLKITKDERDKIDVLECSPKSAYIYIYTHPRCDVVMTITTCEHITYTYCDVVMTIATCTCAHTHASRWCCWPDLPPVLLSTML